MGVAGKPPPSRGAPPRSAGGEPAGGQWRMATPQMRPISSSFPAAEGRVAMDVEWGHPLLGAVGAARPRPASSAATEERQLERLRAEEREPYGVGGSLGRPQKREFTWRGGQQAVGEVQETLLRRIVEPSALPLALPLPLQAAGWRGRRLLGVLGGHLSPGQLASPRDAGGGGAPGGGSGTQDSQGSIVLTGEGGPGLMARLVVHRTEPSEALKVPDRPVEQPAVPAVFRPKSRAAAANGRVGEAKREAPRIPPPLEKLVLPSPLSPYSTVEAW